MSTPRSHDTPRITGRAAPARGARRPRRRSRGGRILAAAIAALAALGGAAPASATPTLDRVWGTYFGKGAEDYVVDAGQDAAGDIYVLIDLIAVTPDDATLATPGVYQTYPGGLNDAFLAKFDPEGNLLWGTFFGGEDVEVPYRLAVGPDSVVIVGRTFSTTGIATPGAFQQALVDWDDGFVASFTPDGALEWSTYIGTAGKYEWSTGVASDGDGFAYVVGRLVGEVPGLGTVGAHQPTHGGGVDAYLVRFSPSGQLVWGTYYGDETHEEGATVSVNALGEVYVSGTAYGASTAVATAGAHQATSGGHDDCFLARFTTDGARVWGTFYGGEAIDHESLTAALPGGGVLLAGTTYSDTGIATPGTYQPTHPGAYPSFVARLDADGVRQWGTYYGVASGDDFVWAMTLRTDASGAAYVGGVTDAPVGVASPDGYSTALQGSKDAFIVKLDDSGQREWATYYGGSWWDGGYSLVIDGLDRVYLAGSTGSTSGIATPGAHDELLHGDTRDAFLVRFTEHAALIGDACQSPADCRGGPCVDGVCCDSPCGGGADDCQTCRASDGAIADGVCTPLGAEVVCRPAAGSCDVAEHCSGDAGTCPADEHADDGEPCQDGLCSAGACVPPDPDPGTDSSGDTTDGVTTDATTTDDTTDGVTTDTTDGDTTEGTGTDGSTTGTGSGDLPTTGQPGDTSSSDGPTTANNPPSAGEAGEASDTDSDGEPASDDAGCGCRSDASGSLLGAPLLVLLGIRRRRAR